MKGKGKKNYTRILFVAYFPHGKNFAVGSFENDKLVSFAPEHLSGDVTGLMRIEVGVDWFELTAEAHAPGEFRFD